MSNYNIITWNINGLSDAVWAVLKNYLINDRPAIVCLNETKRKQTDLEARFAETPEYIAIINVHKPAHMHGVVMLIRKDVKFQIYNLDNAMGCEVRNDSKKGGCTDASVGRIIAGRVNDQFNIVVTYVPNAGSNWNKPLANLDYRIHQWDPALTKILNGLADNLPTIWLGDINVAPNEIDVTHPVEQSKYAGFTAEERTSFANFITQVDTTGQPRWVDIWRAQHPIDQEYTWFGGRTKMRLDTIIVSAALVSKIPLSYIIPHNGVSDHTVVGMWLQM